MSNITIRKFELPKDIPLEEAIQDLNVLAFPEFEDVNESPYFYISRAMDLKELFIALDGEKLVGYGAGTLFKDLESGFEDSYKKKLNYAAYPQEFALSLKDKLEKDALAFTYEGDISARYYSNELTNNPRINDSDFLMVAMAVHPDYQGRGIGTQLIKQRLTMAKEQGAAQAFVDCWENGGSKKLYENAGFKPILYTKPAFPDGSGEFFMGKSLN